ncbi:MAG: hypothetical protein SFU27_00550 [Thermonemataceae bacterium]|nr:hypothetical protein [Thermonemataceae bacterium]
MKIKAFYLIICLLSAFALFSCKHYHNVFAHYNGYFLAEQKMIEVEKRIFESRKDNFNRVLYVYPLLDTNQLKGYKADLEDCIKKAAFAIERHEKSNWTDDAYTLVGKARLYNNEIRDAISTLKYVNGNSKDKLAQEKALIELMKVYIHQKEYTEADMVKNYLRKIEVQPKNLEAYYLTQAHLYRLRQDYDRTAKSLDLALPLMKKGEKKARIAFLQGQLYQKLNQENKAFESYRKVLRNKPTYEMELQARLAILLTGDSVVVFSEKTEKILQKMLKDLKNQEFLDEIYYDLAMIELKRKNLPKAIENLQKASTARGTGQQKPYTFLRLAEIHFDKLKKYEQAKMYYDSTIAFLPKDEEGYEKIAKRHEVLDEFIKYLRTAQMEDSLQKMSVMNEKDLDDFLSKNLNAQVKAEVEKQKTAEKARQKAIQEQELLQKSTLKEEKTKQNSAWYFDNPSQVEEGKKSFREKWGNRPLADNWRLLSKISNEIDENAPKDALTDKEKAIAEQDFIKTEVEQRKQKIRTLLLKDKEQVAKSQANWENASFNLAKIYHFQLDELSEAEQVYLQILKRTPDSERQPEVHYLLYLLYKQQKNQEKQDEFARLIFTKYPESVFANLVKNPNYLLENQEKNEEAQKEYALIYANFYETKKWKEVTTALDELSQKYPDNSIKEKIGALRIIALGNAKESTRLIQEIDVFLQAFPKSEFVDNFNLLKQKAIKEQPNKKTEAKKTQKKSSKKR